MTVSDCSCTGDIIPNLVQCKTCGCSYTCDASGNCTSSTCSPAKVTNITQKRVWNTVRVASSEYTMNLGSLSVYQPPSTDAIYNGVNWNQMSDRAKPGNLDISKITVVPSHGNSTKYSLTRARPGSQRPGGKGVDVKHGSYARYLARLKGKGPLRTQQNNTLTTQLAGVNGRVGYVQQNIAIANDVKGNKTKSFGITASSNRAGSCLCLFPHYNSNPNNPTQSSQQRSTSFFSPSLEMGSLSTNYHH